MKNEEKFKKTISHTIFWLGMIVNTAGFFASLGATRVATGICWIIDLITFLVFCLWLKKYDLYTKTTMLLLGMFLFPTIFYLATEPEQAILYDFILPSIYAISIRKKRDLILPIFNGLLISTLVFFKLDVVYAIIFLVIYLFSILLTSLFSMALFGNFNELEKAYDFITDVAKRDRLTGIYNRFGLESAVKDKANVLCYAIMIDIDFFKQVNDTYGHEKGDEVLFTLGSILKNYSSEDFIVSRYGGEEFLLYSFKDYKDTLDILMDIYTKVEEKIIIDGSHVHISSGISEQGYVSEKLVSDADKNLYYSKTNGRNRITHQMQNVEIVLKK